MKRRALIVLAVAATVPALVGCTTTPGQCDPKGVDFFKNTGCLASGAYDQRRRTLESTLATEQSRNAAFRAVLAELQAEQAQVKGQLHARQTDYARLDSAWRTLKQGLSQQAKTNRDLAARVERLDGEVSARKATDTAAEAENKHATRDDLRRQVTLLERELDAGIYD